MEADDIVFWFSIIVSALVALWAIIIIRAYNNIGKD
ncbi:hypothetical protein DFQ05_2588 [Winogradskyella wandonensis]|uniref:Uncharacterized protein n=2 Tax=Winogradskyella TaxID=286104 RepID=A0A4R1KM22_9FLAO|nr:hypothetical protein DFQ05_2588 [Winogradskyella wandonensis]SHH68515.1 hypothetical protein SAMN05444148_2667 [Winogradskyella jejuensis]